METLLKDIRQGIRSLLKHPGFKLMAVITLALVIRQGALLAIIGAAVGLGGAFALTRLMTGLLFGVTPTDAFTFSYVPLCLILIALLACYIPARRAKKVDPLVALRYE